MRRWLRIIFLVLSVFLLLLAGILLNWIHLPVVPVFAADRPRLVGILTCAQLEKRTWNSIQISGEYISQEPLWGYEFPRIIAPYYSNNCPDFIQPR